MPWRNLQTSAPRFKVTCDVCGLDGWNTDDNFAHEVKGWIAPRKGGGANHIRNQKKTGKYRHKACLDEEGDVIDKAVQDSLF